MTFNDDVQRIQQDLINVLGITSDEQKEHIITWFRRNFEIVTVENAVAMDLLVRQRYETLPRLIDHIIRSSAAKLGVAMAENFILSVEPKQSINSHHTVYEMRLCAMKRTPPQIPQGANNE